MKDRVPTPGQEGRVKITPESGGVAYYAKLEMADNPTQVGDEPIKANLLPDDVATALGLTGNPQVKDALEKIKTLVDGNTTLANSKAQIVIGSYTGTGTYGVDNPNSLAIPEGAKIFMFLTPWSHPAAYLPQWAFSPNSINAQVLYGTPINLASIPSDYVSIIDSGTKIKKSGNSLYWYDTSNAGGQCNSTEVDYHYAFIG